MEQETQQLCSYNDHAGDPEINIELSPGGRCKDATFPMKLHYMLSDIEAEGLESVVSWQPHGRSFIVHKPDFFTKEMLPKWFRQEKYASFQRQLNLYNFRRITKGRDKGGYYHELFLRGKFSLSSRIKRTKIKGNNSRKVSSKESGPDFYSLSLKPLPPSSTKRNKTKAGDEPGLKGESAANQCSRLSEAPIPADPGRLENTPPRTVENARFRPPVQVGRVSSSVPCLRRGAATGAAPALPLLRGARLHSSAITQLQVALQQALTVGGAQGIRIHALEGIVGNPVHEYGGSSVADLAEALNYATGISLFRSQQYHSLPNPSPEESVAFNVASALRQRNNIRRQFEHGE